MGVDHRVEPGDGDYGLLASHAATVVMAALDPAIHAVALAPAKTDNDITSWRKRLNPPRPRSLGRQQQG
jgi:hypothetical protein